MSSDLQIPYLAKVALLGLQQAGGDDRSVMERQAADELKESEAVKTVKR